MLIENESGTQTRVIARLNYNIQINQRVVYTIPITHDFCFMNNNKYKIINTNISYITRILLCMIICNLRVIKYSIIRKITRD